MKYTIADWGKGLNIDSLASELEPGVSTGATMNVRFRNGFAERVGGPNPSVEVADAPHWVSMFQTPNGGVFDYWVVYASATKAYAVNTGSAQITPYTEGVAISTSTNVGTTATVNTATPHGRTTGQTISRWGAVPTAYNGTFVITVVDADTFTYTMASDPGGSATKQGLYSYNGAVQNFTNNMGNGAPNLPQQYSGGPLNGIMILNSPADGLYYWNGDSSTRLRKIPTSYKARVSRPFGNYIVQLAPTIDGTDYPYRVVWSSATEPGSIPSTFVAAEGNDAGDVELADSGELIDCLPLGDALIIYTTSGRYSMRYIGGNQVFEFVRLPGTDGLLWRGAVVDTPVGHVFLSNSHNVLVHNGGDCRDISTGRIGSWIKFYAGPDYMYSFLLRNASKNEVWVCIPRGSDYADRFFLWNWKEDTWGVKALTHATNDGTAATLGFRGAVTGVPGSEKTYEMTYVCGIRAGEVTGYIGKLEHATDDFFNEPFTTVIERTGLDLGDRDSMKTLQRSRWNLDAPPDAVITIQHGSSMTADGTPTYTSPVTYTPGTSDYVCAMAPAGRFLAVKVTITETSATSEIHTKLRSCDLDVTVSGKR